MEIVLDNIVFSLQQSGGISTLWGELIEHLQQEDTSLSFLDYTNATNNIVRKKLILDEAQFLKTGSFPLSIERFRSPQLSQLHQKFLYCSSYYRTSANKNAVNVTIVHDFTHEHYHKGFRTMIHTRQKHNAIKNADGVICISENTKKDLLHFFPETNPEKIQVIYNGVAQHFYPLTNSNWEDLDPAFTFLKDKICLLFVGHRAGYKNFKMVAETIASLPEKYQLIVVGEPFSEEEKSRINQLNIFEKITLFSKIDNATLNQIYNYCFVLLYPSLYEGFGIPVLEAMQCGLPVIASYSTSIPEVAGNAGILLSEMTIENLKIEIQKLENQDYYNQQSKLGLQQASKFSWQKTMQDYFAYFNQLFQQ